MDHLTNQKLSDLLIKLRSLVIHIINFDLCCGIKIVFDLGLFLFWAAFHPPVVYFHQLSGAARTPKPFELLFFSRFGSFFDNFHLFSDFMSEIKKKRWKMNKKNMYSFLISGVKSLKKV